jgi:molecular chaperone DnaK
MSASQSFTQKLYEAASAESAAAGGNPGDTAGPGASQPADDDVVDAEIVDDEEQA